MNMKYRIVLIITTILSSTVNGRGPHHPRGASVSKKHVHYKPTKTYEQKITQDEQLLHDKEHIKEHLDDMNVEPDLSKMTDEELEFYYFQVHDTDKNYKLDGLEILQAILHTTEHTDHGEDTDDQQEGVTGPDNKKNDFEYYVELIDRVLAEDDLDKDGYLDYVEYSQGKKKSARSKPTTTEAPSVQLVP